MIKRLLFFTMLFAMTSLVYSNGITRMNLQEAVMQPDEFNPWVNTNKTYVNTPLVLEGVKRGAEFWFGPEVAMTGLSGYYDYQTNGDNKHQINRFNSTIMHGTMMVSTDSANQNDSRRTKYSFSDDDGATWTDYGNVPSIRSGFVSLTSKSDGSAVLGMHYVGGGITAGFVNYDILPGTGVFSEVQVPPNFIWPGVSLMSNGNILVAGETYQGTAATDSGAVVVFNTTTNTMSNYNRLRTSATSHTNMRWTYASGPGGNSIYVLDAISDAGGNFGQSRIFLFKTTDAGVTWGAPTVLFDAQIVGSDTLTAFFGLDAIYDAAGNYYVAFNTTDPTGNFASAKMWVSKNSGPPVLVAQHTGTNGVPGAAATVLHADAGISTIDHPTLSISADGNTIFCAFSVQFEADTLNGFNKCHIFYSYSPTSSLSFATPIQVTNSGPGSFDERYPSLSPVAPDLGGNMGTTLYLAYQKDPQPGSCAFNDLAPISRSTMIHRKIYQANDPIGIVNINTQTPKSFSLSQNYPNPFNPTTKIRFAVPKSEYVTLKLYNALGKEVGTLVSQQVTPGTFEYELNASSLSSGIYFYVLQAGDFKDSKKLILVK